MAKKKDSVVMQEQDLQQVSAQQRAVQIGVKAFTYLFLGVMALIVLGAMMIPIQVTFIPLYIIIARVGLMNTYWGVWIAGCVSSYAIFLLRQAFMTVDDSYLEAARVDGTPRWRVLTRITVPLLSPMLAYVIITSFIGGFKEYSSIVGIFGEDMGPVGAPLKLNTMVGYIYEALPDMNYGVASAAALILFGIILVVTMINLQVSKKRVHF